MTTKLARARGRYQRVQEHHAKTLAEVTTLTGDLEEANLTINGHVLRNKDFSNRFSALRRQVDASAPQKDLEHVSTQTDPLPSLITSPSLAAGRKPPPPDGDAPDMAPGRPGDGTGGMPGRDTEEPSTTPDDSDLSTPKHGGKSAFLRQKYKHKLGAASVTPSSTPNTLEIPDSDTHSPCARTKELSQCFTTPKKIYPLIVQCLDVNFGIMSATKSASKSHPEVIPVLQGLLKEEVIEKSRLKTSLQTQMGVHNRFGHRKKPNRFAPYRKPRKDITCDTLKMKILDFYNSDDQSVKVSANAIGGGDVGDTISVDREDPLPSSQSSQSSQSRAILRNPASPKLPPPLQRKKRKQKDKPIKQQARHLKDYIHNLYERFVFQNAHAPVKSTTFYALRPKNIQVVSRTSRCQAASAKYTRISLIWWRVFPIS